MSPTLPHAAWEKNLGSMPVYGPRIASGSRREASGIPGDGATPWPPHSRLSRVPEAALIAGLAQGSTTGRRTGHAARSSPHPPRGLAVARRATPRPVRRPRGLSQRPACWTLMPQGGGSDAAGHPRAPLPDLGNGGRSAGEGGGVRAARGPTACPRRRAAPALAATRCARDARPVRRFGAADPAPSRRQAPCGRTCAPLGRAGPARRPGSSRDLLRPNDGRRTRARVARRHARVVGARVLLHSLATSATVQAL